jgi:hypothetical protein
MERRYGAGGKSVLIVKPFMIWAIEATHAEEHMGKHVAVISPDAGRLSELASRLARQDYKLYLFALDDSDVDSLRRFETQVLVVDIPKEHREPAWQLVGSIKLDPILRRQPLVIFTHDGHFPEARAAFLRSHGVTLIPRASPEELCDRISQFLEESGSVGAA